MIKSLDTVKVLLGFDLCPRDSACLESAIMASMDATAQTQTRWFHLTPGRFVLALLAVEVLLWLSERFGWLGWHKGYAVLTGVAAVGVAMLVMLGWFGVALVFRRQFQFSIRTLLVLVVVVALPCSWFAVEMKKAREQNAAIAAIAECGGETHSAYKIDASGLLTLNGRQPLGPRWLRRLLGEDFFSDIAVADFGHRPVMTDRPNLMGGQWLNRPFHGMYIESDHWIDNVQGRVTDAQLAEYLKALPEIHVLILEGTEVTDAGLEHLKKLTQLQKLELGDTHITDSGLQYLAGLPGLQFLELHQTRITDQGLKHLEASNQLQGLNLHGTQVTDAGVAKLQQALPNCRITR